MRSNAGSTRRLLPHQHAALLALVLLAASAAADDLICDGKIHDITMPAAPYPTGTPWNPITNQPDFTCARLKPSANVQCGAADKFACGQYIFPPVSFGSGNTPGIISPNNPVIYSIADAAKYLTYIEWTAVDVGTAGAKLAGAYSVDAALPSVVQTYAWVPNGPIILADGTKVYATCTNCVYDAGIKVMSVTAAPGTGFKSMELSQLYVNTRCEGSGVNDDGIYWSGMKYICVQPTCGDTNLNTPGSQRYACVGADLVYNPSADDKTTLDDATCCLKSPSATCGNIDPDGIPNTPYKCPVGTEYDPSTANKSPANDANCCKPATCGNTKPVSQPNIPYTCPANTQFNPSMSGMPPSDTNCCKPATCSNTLPITKPNTPFGCAAGSTFDPDMSNESPPSQALCCKFVSCGNSDPNKPNQAYTCPSGSEFDPSMSGASPPSDTTCCKLPKCGNVLPISQPGTKYTCPTNYEYDSSKADTSPASTANCCLQKTCDNVTPATAPNTKYTCPKNTEYDPNMGNAAPPTDIKCCVPGTCGNILPVTDPNTPFNSCPAGSQYNPAAATWPISVDNCCKEFIATCGNSDITTPGVEYACPNGLIFNTSAVDLPASEDNCCFDSPTIPSGKLDVGVTKTVSPAIAGNQHLSQTKTVGFVFEFTITVTLNGLDPALDVVMTDQLPDGLQLQSVTEPEGVCSYTLTTVRCSWARLNKGDKKVIKVKAKAIKAGRFLNPAEVTAPKDSNPKNNRDNSTVVVQGACCSTSTLPPTCKDVTFASDCPSGSFKPTASCATTTCSEPRNDQGACCITELGRCTDGLQQSQCIGTWYKQKICADISCKPPVGACCNPQTGQCTDGVPRSLCPSIASWKQGTTCQAGGYCSGSCCDINTGSCQQSLKKNCIAPRIWSIYKECELSSCPSVDPVCIPKWYKCNPPRFPGDADPCCDGSKCQYTYKGCKVGEYVCKPVNQCVDEGGSCGGTIGGCCCHGLNCKWDYFSRTGTCARIQTCCKQGARCGGVKGDCCSGNRCISGRCQPATYNKCKRPCKSFECYVDRRKDCECLRVTAAEVPAVGFAG